MQKWIVILLTLGLVIFGPRIFPQSKENSSQPVHYTTIQIHDKSSHLQSSINTAKSKLFHTQTFYKIKNSGNNEVAVNLPFSKKNWQTNQEIVESALENDNNLSDEDKAITLWTYISQNVPHHHPPFYGADFHLTANPIHLFNNWGYGYCSDRSFVLAQLNIIAGLDARVVQLNEHLVMESYYDGAWHMFDPTGDTKTPFFIRNSDGSIASTEGISNNLDLLSQTSEIFNMGEYGSSWVEKTMSFGVINYYDKDLFFPSDLPSEMNLVLQKDDEIIYYNNWKDSFYWDFRDTPPPTYTNGLYIKSYVPEDSHQNISLPYPLLKSTIYLLQPCDSNTIITIQKNDRTGKKYDSSNCKEQKIEITDFFAKGEGTKPIFEYQILGDISKIESIETQFQFSQNSIPSYHDVKNNSKIIEELQKNELELSFGFH